MPIEIRRIISEVVDGKLANETPRLGDAAEAFDFYFGRFDAYPTREENQFYRRADRRRTRRFMRRVVRVLTGSLYKKPPVRELATGPDATAWLNRVYAANAMAAVWPEADRFAHVGHVAALQFSGNADDATGVDVQLWGAHEFVVWAEPDNPRVPAAVGVIDKFDASSRLRLWTAADYVVFVRDKVDADGKAPRSWRLQSRTANEYGTIPFAFVHYDVPTTDFWTPGPGPELARANDNINGQLDEIGDAVRFGSLPIGLTRNAAPGWTPPAKMKPGQYLNIPGRLASAGDELPPEPTLEFVGPPLEGIDVNWSDLDRYTNTVLEDEEIPPGLFRMLGESPSGVALLLESEPIMKRAEARRTVFDDAENRAAKKLAQVAAAHLRNNGRAVPAWLDATAEHPAPVSLRWAPLYVQLPGAERDRSDDWLLAHGLADKVEVLMQRYDLTEDEAFARLRQIARRNAQLAAMGIDPAAPPESPAAGAVAGAPTEVTPQTAE